MSDFKSASLLSEGAEAGKNFLKHVQLWLAHILGAIGVITAIFNFIKLWDGDTWVRTFALAGAGTLFIVVWLLYIGFSRQETAQRVVGLARGPSTPSARRPYRFRKLHNLARVVLLTLIVGATIFAGILHKRQHELHQKITILVANFYSKDPSQYQVTEAILSQLRQSLSKYNDTRLIAPDEVITEQKSERAILLGKRYDADLVLWGRYVVTTAGVQLVVHVTNVVESKCAPLPSAEPYETRGTLDELDHFVFQERISKEMSALTLFVSGWTRFAARDFGGCIENFNQALALEKWPDSLLSKAVLFAIRGDAFDSLGNTQDAMNSYLTAVNLDSQFGAAYNNLGVLYAKSKDYKQAISYYTLAIKNSPKPVQAYANRAFAHFHLRELEDAIKDASEAIALCPALARGYHLLGHAYSIKGDLKRGYENYSKAADLDPKTAENYYGLGLIRLDLRDFQGAISQFEKVITLDPQSAVAYQKLGVAYQGLDNIGEAVRCSEKATAIDPQLAEAHSLLGWGYFMMGSYGAAIDSLQRALELNNRDFKTAYHLGLTHAARPQLYEPPDGKCSDHKRRAIDWFSKAIEINDQFAPAYEKRAHIYTHCEEDQMALKDLIKAIQLDASAGSAHFALGEVYMRMERKTEAVACFSKVIEIGGDADLKDRAETSILLLQSDQQKQ